jgi:hypothetical protein
MGTTQAGKKILSEAVLADKTIQILMVALLPGLSRRGNLLPSEFHFLQDLQ